MDLLAEVVRAIDGALAGEAARSAVAPWHGWLLVVLMRQRTRQAWHRQVVGSLSAGEHDDDDDDGNHRPVVLRHPRREHPYP